MEEQLIKLPVRFDVESQKLFDADGNRYGLVGDALGEHIATCVNSFEELTKLRALVDAADVIILLGSDRAIYRTDKPDTWCADSLRLGIDEVEFATAIEAFEALREG